MSLEQLQRAVAVFDCSIELYAHANGDTHLCVYSIGPLQQMRFGLGREKNIVVEINATSIERAISDAQNFVKQYDWD